VVAVPAVADTVPVAAHIVRVDNCAAGHPPGKFLSAAAVAGILADMVDTLAGSVGFVEVVDKANRAADTAVAAADFAASLQIYLHQVIQLEGRASAPKIADIPAPIKNQIHEPVIKNRARTIIHRKP